METLIRIESKLQIMNFKENLLFCMVVCGCTLAFLFSVCVVFYHPALAFAPSDSPSIQTPLTPSGSPSEPLSPSNQSTPGSATLPAEEAPPISIPTAQNFLSYENASVGIKMQYPDNWEIMDLGNSVVFHTPLQSNETLFSEQVGILTLDDSPLPNEEISQFFQRMYENFKSTYPDYSVNQSPAPGNFSDNPALATYFVSNEGNIKHNVLEIWTVDLDKNRAYQIEISVIADKYPSFIPEHIMKMIESLEFI